MIWGMGVEKDCEVAEDTEIDHEKRHQCHTELAEECKEDILRC